VLGVLLAAIGTIGFGLVLGPEAPLIALGTGLAILTVRATRRELPDQALLIVGAAGSFAALSFIFTSPIIAAVILIEATGLGGARQRIILLPGLLAAGIGNLASIGMGSLTGSARAITRSARSRFPASTSRCSETSRGRSRWRSPSRSSRR
jgi:H+/Cl- antiporter ClcA